MPAGDRSGGTLQNGGKQVSDLTQHAWSPPNSRQPITATPEPMSRSDRRRRITMRVPPSSNAERAGLGGSRIWLFRRRNGVPSVSRLRRSRRFHSSSNADIQNTPVPVARDQSPRHTDSAARSPPKNRLTFVLPSLGQPGLTDQAHPDREQLRFYLCSSSIVHLGKLLRCGVDGDAFVERIQIHESTSRCRKTSAWTSCPPARGETSRPAARSPRLPYGSAVPTRTSARPASFSLRRTSMRCAINASSPMFPFDEPFRVHYDPGNVPATPAQSRWPFPSRGLFAGVEVGALCNA